MISGPIVFTTTLSGEGSAIHPSAMPPPSRGKKRLGRPAIMMVLDNNWLAFCGDCEHQVRAKDCSYLMKS
jgi:hypothetical protein